MNTDDLKLVVTQNSLNSTNTFMQMLRLENKYYAVTLSYANYTEHKAANKLNKAFVKVDGVPFDPSYAPQISGIGDGLNIIFYRIAVSSEEGLDILKENLTAVEATIKQIKTIINKYFTNN